ncbi:hypothetical protein [Agathobaculum sp.]|uniref:hypothetical protein n=1 Tax=Agathobaculum sp. TaxID=2048138 RepID=UPI002A80F036|nr:hypothetical protein [Agathobaculum sp.]MDY3618512.1 hypothetical protein [Agathobaculum sp.]
MMELFRMILLRVTLAGAAASVALAVSKDSALREIVRVAAGLLMALALLQPLAQVRLPPVSEWFQKDGISAAEVQRENSQTAMSAVGAAIADVLEQRAAKTGIDCTVRVDMATDADGVLQADHVTVYYKKSDASRLEELQQLLTEECGVPAERQELIQK